MDSSKLSYFKQTAHGTVELVTEDVQPGDVLHGHLGSVQFIGIKDNIIHLRARELAAHA